MRHIQSKLKQLIIYVFITVQLVALTSPMTAVLYAQEAPAVDVIPATVEQAPLASSPGTQSPTGASAFTYTYNPESGLYENAYYTWNPSNRQTTPRFEPEHILNQETKMWEVKQWVFAPAKGGYEYRVVQTYPQTPTLVQNEAAISNTGPDSTNSIKDANGSITNTGPSSSNTVVGEGFNSIGVIDTTGPQSSNTILLGGGGKAIVDDAVLIDLTNSLYSSSISGNANVLQNTNAGDAMSGNAITTANILNMLQSNWGGALPEMYVANIQGDYFGDIMINPSMLGVDNKTDCGCGDLMVNSSFDASITNDLDLIAKSGDATVSRNTNAGSASSGDATALVNVINMINSSITSGQSFLGILNINGNFTGDVLLAQDVIDELLAANVPTTELNLCNCGDVLADFTNNQTIINNISATAESGLAEVSSNTNAGNATSGSAQTSVTVFNVTGHEIVGQNALLVFVNVLGEWIGFMVDAPNNATAGLYGGNVVKGLSGSTSNEEFKTVNNSTITNDISVAAHTGDATVSENTYGGNASSGNADASANVSNIIGSNFSLAGWFGLLFINVMGDWYGSFGQNTEYGNIPAETIINSQVQNPKVQTAYTFASSKPISMATAQKVTNRPKNVRVFEAVLQDDKDGGVVVAGVSDANPLSIDSGFGAPQQVSQIQGVIAGWSLLILGLGAIGYFMFRRSRN